MDLDPGFGVGFIQRRVAGHRAAVPVLEQAPGGQDEGILVVGFLHDRHIIERMELAASAGEILGEECRRAGMVHAGDRIDQPDLVDAPIGDAGIIHVDRGHLAQDLFGGGVVPSGGGGASQTGFESGREIAKDLPVGARLAAGRLSRTHSLDAAVRVGKCSIFFGKRRGGQEDIRKRAGLVDEQVLGDEELKMGHVFAGLI